MHLEILVEDQSGAKALTALVPKIIDPQQHSYKITSYKGVGRIPKDLQGKADPSHRILLDQLPRFLRGFGKTFAAYPADYPAAVVVVFDLDDKCLKQVRQDLLHILNSCDPKPETRFCIAIEEGEAWFLGDQNAIKAAYPRAKQQVLDTYEQDAICGTWEKLADAVYPGGAADLAKLGWVAVGAEKSVWAEKITPHMDAAGNQSPSFQYFCKKLLELAS